MRKKSSPFISSQKIDQLKHSVLLMSKKIVHNKMTQLLGLRIAEKFALLTSWAGGQVSLYVFTTISMLLNDRDSIF